MRVLHAPENIAGQASIISRAERRLGIQSDVLVFQGTVFNYECDINLEIDRHSAAVSAWRVFSNFLICFMRYDIFHFHFGKSLLPFNIDLPLYRLIGKKTLMHYWGSDVIQTDVAGRYTRIPKDVLKEVYPTVNNERRRKKLHCINKLVNRSIVGDYSLLPHSPQCLVVRQAVDISSLPFIGSVAKTREIRIVHAPTLRGLKGTDSIISTVDKLKREGFPIDFVIVEKKPHTEAIEIFKTADIVIDDILQGPYGILAIECMALGKPVLDYINEDLIEYYPGLPIVNVSPDTLYEQLKILINDPALRETLGMKGREYVLNNHDSAVIASRMISIYREL